MRLFRRLFHLSEKANEPLYPVHICTDKDVLDHIITVFDFKDIPYITASSTDAPRYLLNNQNRALATRDIIALNGFLDHARDVCNVFPSVQISEELLQFDPPNDPDEDLMFCFLRTNVFTKTGKISKYPVSLHFSEKSEKPFVYDPAVGYEVRRVPNKTFGTIEYLADGEIGKIRIISWKNGKIYDLHCKTNIYGFLELCKIECHGEVIYQSETNDIHAPEKASPCIQSESNTIAGLEEIKQPKKEPKVITRYEEETVYYTLSDTEIQDIKSAIEFVFDQFHIPSVILDHRSLDAYTEFDLSVPDGIRLKKLLSFRDEIDIRIPKTTIDMDPDFERGVVVIRVKHRSEQVMVPREEVVEAPTNNNTEEDQKIIDAIDIVVEAGMASTTLLQRKLNLGYARAARLIDELEERNIVGPFDGSRPRKVLISKQEWAEMRIQLPYSAPLLDKEPQDDNFE